MILSAMVSSSQLRDYLSLYAANRISFVQFEDWFIPNTRDIRKTHSESAIHLTFEIEAALAEYLSQILNEQELREELSDLAHAETKSAVYKYNPQVISTVFSSSSPLVIKLVPVQL
jgi:hypothetical protein